MSWRDGLEHFVREDEPLAPRCWLRSGGDAEFFAEPPTQEDLVTLIERCANESIPVRVLGGGSNVLVRPEGVKGVTIHLGAPVFGGVDVNDQTITAGGGVALSHVITSAVGAGLAGLEQLVGIPGTVGGALHGNSGDRATDVGDWTESVTVLTRSGELRTLAKNEMTFSYRSSSVDELAIVNATFRLEPESKEELIRRMQKLWIVKRSRQPSGAQSAGCLFKDPLGVSASEVIEQANLKSATVGGARLLDRDPNFVTLSDDASTADVVALIEQIREKVSQQLGVELETSLQIW